MKLNLATRIYLDTRRIRFSLGILTAASMLFLGWNIHQTVTVHQEIASLRAMIARQNLTSGSRTVSEVDYQKALARLSHINGFLSARSPEWVRLLDSLEMVVPDGVMLTEISPAGGKESGVYRINGYAADFQRVRRLFERMSAGDLFSDVFLVSQSRLRVTESQQGVSFTLSARVKQ